MPTFQIALDDDPWTLYVDLEAVARIVWLEQPWDGHGRRPAPVGVYVLPDGTLLR